MFNAGVRGKRAKDGVGFLSTAEQFNQKSFLIPTVTSFSVTDVSYVPLDDTAVDTDGGQTIVINGSGFASGATVQVGATTIGSVTFIDQNRLAFTAPALSSGSYTIYVTNSNGGTGILLSGLVYSGLPTFTTTAGTLGTVYETANINTSVVATGDAPITYTLLSGTLPAGANINSNGTITGNAPVDGSSTTYSFTIQATDGQLQDSTRAFTLTINIDVLSWGLANNTVYSLDGGAAMSNVTLSATSSANSNSAVTFAANTLPTGVSLSGNTIFGTPTVEETVYTAVTATATQTGRTATRFVSWVISVSDLFFKYNTLLIPGASTTFVDDASTNNFAVTINGDTKPNSFNPYTPGYYSNFFDGTGDYLSVPSSANLAFGTGDFCVEMWYYQTASAGVALFSNSTSSGGGDAQFEIQLDPVNLYPRLVGWASIFLTSSVASSINRWNHLVVNRSGTTASMFLNGTRVATAIVSNNFSSTNAFNIGRQASNSGYLTGYISNLRAVKGSSVYDPTQSTITVPTSPLTAIANTSLLTCQSNRFIDSSTNAFTITVTGNTSISSFDPFVPNSNYSTYGSGYFDGTGDYLTAPANTAFQFTGNYTIEFWVNFSTTSGNQDLVSNYNAGGSADWIIMMSATGFQYYPSSASSYVFSGVGSVIANTWYHVAAVRSGTTCSLYVNGVSVGTPLTFSGTLGDNSKPIYFGSRTGASGYFTGYMTDVRIVKGTAVYTTTFTPPTTPLTAVANTQLLTLQNNQPVNNSTFLDNSTNNFLVTRAGNTTQGTFSPYGGNWSNFFNGSTDYLSVSNNAALMLGAGNFTIECWFYITGNSASNPSSERSGQLITKFQNTSNYYTLYVLGNSSTTGNALRLEIVVGGSLTTIQYTGTIAQNQWQHFAAVRNGSGSNNIVLYLNGSSVATGTNTATDSNTGPVYIGYYGYPSYPNYFNGYISNARIVKGTAVYTGNFTPSTTPLTSIANTSLLTCADSRFIDDSLNAFALTTTGTPSIQRFSPFNPSVVTPTSYSGYFDGTGDYLSVPSNAAFDLGASDFTIECWFNPQSFSAAFGLISRYNYVLGVGSGWVLRVVNSTTLRFAYGNDIVIDATVSLNTNSWYHLAVSRSVTTAKMFLNGTQVGSFTVNNFSDASSALQIGRTNTLTDDAYAYMTDVRVIKGTAVYTSAFTPPSSPLTAIANTSLLTCQNSTFIDNSTNNFTITAAGNSQPTQQNPFGFTSTTTNGYTVSTIGGSGYFDGTGDYLTVPSSTAFYLATGDFTIEAWIYKRTSGKQIIVGQTQNNGSPYAGWVLYVDNSSLLVFEGTNGALIGSPTVTVPLNAWTHIAIVKSGSTVTIYQNGVSVNSGGGPAITNFNTVLAIGNYSFYTAGADWNGYISDLRIVKGTAIYSSNFVPPAAPILSVQNTSLLTNMTSAGIYDASMITTMESGGDAKLSTAVSKFGGSSMYFDGTGDYMVASGTTATGTSAFGSGDFTIEFWLYANSVAATDQGLIDMRPTSTNGYYPYLYMYNGQVTYWLNATAVINSSAGAITTGTWYHIALARSGSSNKLFINGVQSGSTFTSSTALLCDSNRPAIGSSGTTLGGSPLNGYIDDLRITKGYARYTSNFTAPITSFKTK